MILNKKKTESDVFKGVMSGLKDAKKFLAGELVKCKIHHPNNVKNVEKQSLPKCQSNKTK